MSTQDPMLIDTLTTDELKVRFKARTIPLESDFADLIDVAECGRRAVGANPEQTPNSSSGLILDSGQQLMVQADVAKGIAVGASGVGVVANTAKGIAVDANGVGVVANAAKGIAVDASGVGVVANAAKGITVDASGVGVVANAAKGIAVDTSGVGVNVDSTLRIVNNQLGIPDTYVTKTGNSTITNGNLTFASDDKGVYFYGGSKIIKKYGTNMLWYKGTNNALPQICNNDGSSPSNIATEGFVNDRVIARRTMTIASAGSKALFWSGSDAYSLGEVTLFIDKYYMFTLTWRYFYSYSAFSDKGVISVSSVAGSSNALANVRYGHTQSTGYGSCLWLDFNSACTVECFYNLGNIYGTQFVFGDGGFAISNEAVFKPTQNSTQSWFI